MEENASLFTNNSTTPCDFNITNHNSVTNNTNDTNISHAPKQFSIHSQSKHKYRNTFGESNICRASARPPAFLSTTPRIPSGLDGKWSHMAPSGYHFLNGVNDSGQKLDSSHGLKPWTQASANQRPFRH